MTNSSKRFPVKLGYDVSGVVAAIGDSVTEFKVGDEVFCCLPWEDRGAIPALSSCVIC
jgi:NADPH:quinone reductase-like Zn-dependent oxidoreductase